MKRYKLRILFITVLFLAADHVEAQDTPMGTILPGEVVGGDLSFYSDKACETVITGTVSSIVYIKATPATGHTVESMTASDIIVEKTIETGAAQARRSPVNGIPLGETIAVSATETAGVFCFTMPADGADVKASATIPIANYTITYNLAGGALAEGKSNPTSYTIESEAITLNNPTRDGYTFAGWTGTGLTEATTTVTIAKGSTGAKSYTATWTACLKGDANDDGKVDAKDVVEMVNAFAGNAGEKFSKSNADMNGDDVINVADIICLVNRLTENDTE